MKKVDLKSKHMCPICGKTEFPEYLSFEICRVCGWEDDVIDPDDPEDITGANDLEVAEYRARYEAEGRPEWLTHGDAYDDEENT